jgi:hypothetical protein
MNILNNHHLRFAHSTVVFFHPKLSFAICLCLYYHLLSVHGLSCSVLLHLSISLCVFPFFAFPLVPILKFSVEVLNQSIYYQSSKTLKYMRSSVTSLSLSLVFFFFLRGTVNVLSLLISSMFVRVKKYSVFSPYGRF